ncbi:2-oxoacid:acceptor oxidoreductase subunit alpha [Shewanella cyperi]|uniref:2-oxoacid:acceptor oxidoreductase subunit alpha n=1 Tax=Shewanella cyperi TaxID=2814292 RepID=UPI001A94EC97|nr:2-oxoacid:acceptor oxidoreductase subunit alpha [Shewanella cyperi]QSX40332.1 2-oxoacid:acceptor oxidoreductase subunit alpha [Shewanella cyperi]
MNQKINDFVVRFANTNGTGSASANNMFAKAIFRMGIPVSAKNIFPSNIQGMPTWYEVRVSDKGYLGRRGGRADLLVAMNAQSLTADIQSVESGGYLFYDSSKPLDEAVLRDDIHMLGMPISMICVKEYSDPRQRQLFKNVIYIGALAALLEIEFQVLKDLISDQFKGKEKLITPNIHALEIGFQFATSHFECPLPFRVERREFNRGKIMMDGNTATALGALYGGATVVGWYPITPSTSVVEKFAAYCQRLRIDPASGNKNFAIVQAEDELAAMGMVLGATWNGARAFTATSGPGVSLMTEFLGLGYFAELPAVLINVQRAGPSTGMPTRTQQADLLACAYASHGDTKHVLLFPADPEECFSLTARAFDIADQLQTPVILMSDLEIGMNDHLCCELEWQDDYQYQRGKVLSAAELDELERYGRYLDVDGDGICYRVLPGEHPQKGAFFTRGTSRDRFAVYTEKGDEYVQNMNRLAEKFRTAVRYLPRPECREGDKSAAIGLIYYGSTTAAIEEAQDLLRDQGLSSDCLRIRAFPFHSEVQDFIERHQQVFVIEQNRDGQMRTLLTMELEQDPQQLQSVLHFDGLPISGRFIAAEIVARLAREAQTQEAG